MAKGFEERAELYNFFIVLPMQQEMICMSLPQPCKVLEITNYQIGFKLKMINIFVHSSFSAGWVGMQMQIHFSSVMENLSSIS